MFLFRSLSCLLAIATVGCSFGNSESSGVESTLLSQIQCKSNGRFDFQETARNSEGDPFFGGSQLGNFGSEGEQTVKVLQYRDHKKILIKRFVWTKASPALWSININGETSGGMTKGELLSASWENPVRMFGPMRDVADDVELPYEDLVAKARTFQEQSESFQVGWHHFDGLNPLAWLHEAEQLGKRSVYSVPPLISFEVEFRLENGDEELSVADVVVKDKRTIVFEDWRRLSQDWEDVEGWRKQVLGLHAELQRQAELENAIKVLTKPSGAVDFTEIDESFANEAREIDAFFSSEENILAAKELAAAGNLPVNISHEDFKNRYQLLSLEKVREGLKMTIRDVHNDEEREFFGYNCGQFQFD